MQSIDLILNESAEHYIADEIAHRLIRQTNPALKYGKLHHEDIRQIRFQLEALGLIRAVTQQLQREGGSSYSQIAWQITERGRRHMAQSLAIKKED